MPWTKDTTTGRWTHTGTTRDVRRFELPASAKSRHVFRVSKVADVIGFPVFANGNAQTCWEVGIFNDFGASSANLSIRLRTNNTPAAPVVAIAHGIPADTPFDIVIEVDSGGFKVSTSVTGVASVTLPASGLQDAGDLKTNTGIGFASAVDGAVILSAQYRLPRPQVDVLNEQLIGCSGQGGIYMRGDDVAWQLLKPSAFNPDDELSIVPFEGIVLLLAYSPSTKLAKGYVIDLVQRTVVPWTAETGYGSLPGAAGPGTTSARHVRTNSGRAWLVTDTEASVSVLPNGVDGVPTYKNWLSDVSSAGAAKRYIPGLQGREGEPVVAVEPMDTDSMLIAKTNSMFVIYGDPVQGNTGQRTLSLLTGLSGRAALCSTGSLGFYAHSPDGAIVIGNEGIEFISKDKLRRFMEFGRGSQGRYTVQVQYDSRSKLVYFFLTPNAATPNAPRRMPVLDLASGEFLLDEYPFDMEPISSEIWRGTLLYGCRDGYVRRLSPLAQSDDGIPLNAWYTLPVIETPGTEDGVKLGRVGLQLGTVASYRYEVADDAADVVVRVYAGATAEDALRHDRRELVAGPRVVKKGRNSFVCSAAAHSLAVEVRGTGTYWMLEEVEVTAGPAGQALRSRRRAATVPSALCRVPVGDVPVTPTNIPPVAIAGADADVTDNDDNGEEIVTCNGSASYDPDGSIVAWEWKDQTGAVRSTVAVFDDYYLVGTHTLTLTVTDNLGATATDTRIIIVRPKPTVDPPVTGPGGPYSTTGSQRDVVADWSVFPGGQPSQSVVGGGA